MLERILGFGILLGVLVRDGFGFGRFGQLILISGSLIGVVYIFLNWWISSPGEKGVKSVAFIILYGLASGCFAFALTFHLLYLDGSDEMVVLSLILILPTLLLDLLTASKSRRVINSSLILRFSVLSIFTIALSAIPIDYRISITYRKYPEFLEYYHSRKVTEESFMTIQDEYFNQDKALKWRPLYRVKRLLVFADAGFERKNRIVRFMS